MKLGAVVVVYYNFTKFHQNRMKNKKVLLIAHFSVQNIKVSVELWKSYIMCLGENMNKKGQFREAAALFAYYSKAKKHGASFFHFFPIWFIKFSIGNSKHYIFIIQFSIRQIWKLYNFRIALHSLIQLFDQVFCCACYWYLSR